MKLLNFLKSKLAITALAMPAAVNYAVSITMIVIDVHSSGSNPPIVKSTITQPQIHIQLVHTLTGHKKAIFGVPAIAISPDGQTLISEGRDDTEFRDFETLAHLSGWFQFRFRACSEPGW